MTLKALIDKVLQCNTPCNNSATHHATTVQQKRPFVARLLHVQHDVQHACNTVATVPVIMPDSPNAIDLKSYGVPDIVMDAVSIFQANEVMIEPKIPGECADGFPVCGDCVDIRKGVIHCKRYNDVCWRHLA